MLSNIGIADKNTKFQREFDQSTKFAFFLRLQMGRFKSKERITYSGSVTTSTTTIKMIKCNHHHFLK